VHDLIVRIAARGEGVTQSGRHVAFGVPGDALLDDGAIAPGPHHQQPPCRHFPECGGCQLQHADDEAYRGYLVSRIRSALAQHDLEAEICDPHLSPPCSRRRATLRGVRTGRAIALGFNAARAHRIIDMHECHILVPELFRLVSPLRDLLNRTLKGKDVAEVQLALVDQGVDVLLRGLRSQGLETIELLTSFASDQRLARLSLDDGLGAEIMYEPQPATITLSGTPVTLPIGAFLQATKDGETALVDSVREVVGEEEPIADLFAGLGTFALPIGATYAAEASRDAAAALKRSGPAITVEHRDLYRRPLDSRELERFGGVILDPPRAGAAEQVRAFASSTVSRIAYVSCNPATFARDARILSDAGYVLGWVRPIGQFRWSTHVELVASFSRRAAGISPRGS
jgi:23S rRNA (uracil1939-C5)-methyltransferase